MADKSAILLVDDEPESLLLMKEMLEDEDFLVESAESGEQALASVAVRKPDLILLDIRMPGMDGFDICGRLKESEKTRDIPVIFITNSAELQFRIKCFKLGAVDFIAKPISPEECLVRIKTHLGLNQLAARLKKRTEELEVSMEQLEKARNEVEKKVEERTNELSEKNMRLLKEVEERKRAEEALAESEKLYNSLVETSHDLIWRCDAQGRYVYLNKRWETVFGYSLDEMLNKPFTMFVSPEIAPMDFEAFKRVIGETGFVYGYETVHIRKDGKPVNLVFNAKAFFDDAGNVLGTQGTAHDITESKKSEEALRASEAELREAQRVGNIGSWDWDATTDTIIWSEEYYRIFDFDPTKSPPGYEEHLKAYTPESGARLDAAVKLSAEKGTPYELDLERARPDGVRQWVAARCEIKRDANGGFIGLRGTVQDITARKLVEEAQLRIQQEEKFVAIGRVAGKMAHDFNNVLGIIMGTSQLLLSGDLPFDIRDDVETIQESAVRGRSITKNLLLFAKDQEAKLGQFDINDRINQLIKSLKQDLKDIEVSVSYGSGMENFLGDAGLLENALTNLMQNAIHAVSKTAKPRIQIRTHCDEKSAVIEIEDNGCGIPDEYKDKVYDPAITLKGSGDRTESYRSDIKGSGYGLANVKRCVEKHGGVVSFESEINRGSTFKATLPFLKEEISAEEIEKVRKKPGVGGKRILIVEDEPFLGGLLYKLLGKFGHSADLATNGEMALDYLKRNAYDAVSLDFILPDMNGMEVYKKIRETNKETPIIFVSGNFEFMQSMIDLKNEDSRVDHLAKPFDNIEYINAIHKWLPGQGGC